MTKHTENTVSLDIGRHLGSQLRDLFAASDRLPQRLVELLEALAAKEEQPAPAQTTLKNDMLALLPNLRAFAVSLCGDPDRADDLVQETILKAWTHIDSFEAGSNLGAWLFTILRNTFYSEIRKKRREVEDSEGERAGQLAVLPSQQGHVDVLEVGKAFDMLSPERREAVVLVGATGLSYEEAAEVTGCAVGTIKSRVHRARIRLAELMGVEIRDSFGPDAATAAIVQSSGKHS
jgi:RNA polymerase sigma-70 factor (ECF subfamily)